MKKLWLIIQILFSPLKEDKTPLMNHEQAIKLLDEVV